MTGTKTSVASDKLVRDFSDVVTDTEQLLKAIATAGGEKTQALRATLEETLKTSRERLRELEERAVHSTRVAARATDQYVHHHPWQSIAIGAGFAAIAGIVVGLLLNRR